MRQPGSLPVGPILKRLSVSPNRLCTSAGSNMCSHPPILVRPRTPSPTLPPTDSPQFAAQTQVQSNQRPWDKPSEPTPSKTPHPFQASPFLSITSVVTRFVHSTFERSAPSPSHRTFHQRAPTDATHWATGFSPHHPPFHTSCSC